jgi:hypothetical protein
MGATYAVKWREPDGASYVGRLALDAGTLRLEGRGSDGTRVDRRIGFDEVRDVAVGSRGPDRLDGRPALIVDRDDGRYLVASAGSGPGIVQEVVERLAELRRDAPHRATVVVPLRDGALEAVRALVSQGPPFDPREAGLTRHEVLVTEREAIFTFESAGDDALPALLERVGLWARAAEWQELVDGPPRLTELAYAWARPAPVAVPKLGLGL